MADQQRTRAVVARQTGLSLSLTDLAIAQLTALWRVFTGWTDPDMVRARAARSATLVEAAQRQARLQQVAYLRQVYNTLGLDLPPAGTEPSTLYPRHGIDIDEVWQRPAEQYRYLKSTGKPDEEALAGAVGRVLHLADMDVSLARRDQSRIVFEATPRVTGYRRILHPELSKSGTCGLCIVAADRVYSVSELLPVHDLCKCGVMPVTSNRDPGLSLNREDLDKLYAAAGGSGAGDLARLRVNVIEHGELGPVLRVQGQNVVEASERQPTGRRGRAGRRQGAPVDRRAAVTAQLESLTASSARLQKRAAGGEDVALALQWQQDRMVTLRNELAGMGAA